jgi:multidrug resistance efflux pump
MLEVLLCSLVTILPDYLYRRFAQGKRFGREITLYTVWYELRWGITGCLLLTISLITLVFYFHPGTKNVTSFYRTIPVLPETGGRVVEVYVGLSEEVSAGQPLFRLDSAVQEAAVETARQRVAEAEAQIALAQTDVVTADGRIAEAESALQQAQDELDTKAELRQRNPDVVPEREIERLQNLVAGRQGALASAESAKTTLEATVNVVLPAARDSAVAQLEEAEAALDKMTVYAGVDGMMEQFTLRVGDYVNPMLRPAGILIPRGAGRTAFQAGFPQIAAGVLRVGMLAEMTCASTPFKVFPMIVTEIQDVISSGQLRQSDLLVDPASVTTPGSITVYLEPLYAGGVTGVMPGSTCQVMAYTSNYDRLHSDEEMSGLTWLTLHAIDAVGMVHAILLRINLVLAPARTLVLSGAH